MNTERARAVVPFCGILRRENGKPTCVHCPASPIFAENGQRGAPRASQISISRSKDKDDNLTLTLDCQCYTINSDADSEKCLGMQNGYLCYHSLAALVCIAMETGGIVNFFVTARRQDAEAAAKAGRGTIIRLRAAYGKPDGSKIGDGFAVYLPPKPKPEDETKKLRKEVEALKAQLAQTTAQPEPLTAQPAKPVQTKKPDNVCYNCETVLTTPEQMEKGLCPDHDQTRRAKPVEHKPKTVQPRPVVKR